MELPQISLIVAVLAVATFAVNTVFRVVFVKKFTGKEFQIMVGKNWEKIRFIGYLLLIFFSICALFILLTLLDMLRAFSVPGLLDVLELVIDSLLFLIALSMLWFSSIAIWGAGK